MLLKSIFKKNPVAVFGLARSGLSAVRFLRRSGAEITAWDDNEKARDAAKDLGATVTPLEEKNLKDCAFLLLSPGVPMDHPVVKAAQAVDVEVICDIELFHRLNHSRKTVGVTGTNGKSTTTALIHHILKSSGRESVMGGNIGVPVFDLEMPGEQGVFVFELSSYQLDLCPTFRPDISVLLNITPDHLDRHGTMKNYAASKERIFEGSGVAVIGVDDALSRAMFERVKAKGEREAVAISSDFPPVAGGRLMEGSVLKGEHNLQNAMAAYAVCRKLGLEETEIFKGIKSFPGLPHRQFLVRTINNVTYINDSKATNAEAAAKALGAYENIYWIAGGRPKQGGLQGLEPLMRRVKEAFLIGEAMEDFAVWMQKNNIPHHECKTLEIAVQQAHNKAQQSGLSAAVLLSPACASWDQFSSYEERGDRFAEMVNVIEESSGV
ncbi:MAG: UDP-N-acetylmuramoyl-L-alanine--D-glutamate ligase [Alphaproteobacteria bacterium]